MVIDLVLTRLNSYYCKFNLDSFLILQYLVVTFILLKYVLFSLNQCKNTQKLWLNLRKYIGFVTKKLCMLVF